MKNHAKLICRLILLMAFFYASFAYAENTPDSLYRNAQALFNKGQYVKAIKEYDRILSLGADLTLLHQVYIYRGLSYQKIGRLDKALEDYTMASKINYPPEPTQAYFSLGIIHILRHEYDKAIIQYDKILSMKPDSNALYQAHVARGSSYQAMGRLDKALEDFTKASKINNRPNPAYVYFLIGSIYYTRGSYGRAFDYYDQAIIMKADQTLLSQINLHRGIYYEVKGPLPKAVDAYTEAIRVQPNDPSLYFTRANLKKRMLQYDQAIADYTRAIQLSPDDPLLYACRAHVQIVNGHQRDAHEDLRKACAMGEAKSCRVYNFLMSRNRF